MGRTKHQMLIGGILLVLSWLVILAMVVELLPSPIWLYMVAYSVSIAGFIIGTIGVTTYIRVNLKKSRDNGDDYYK